jgi:HPt (histidine-containing phosphotransfer) domain-containing protein
MDNGTFAFDNRLDIEYLQSLYEGDTEYAAVIFEQFLQNYPEQWQELEASINREDIKAYKGHIHKMKASFSFVGLTQLTQKAQVIEQHCTENYDIDTVTALQQDFKTSLAQLIPIVEAELKRLQA